MARPSRHPHRDSRASRKQLLPSTTSSPHRHRRTGTRAQVMMVAKMAKARRGDRQVLMELRRTSRAARRMGPSNLMRTMTRTTWSCSAIARNASTTKRMKKREAILTASLRACWRTRRTRGGNGKLRPRSSIPPSRSLSAEQEQRPRPRRLRPRPLLRPYRHLGRTG